jgi:uncharacterized protein YyaL (SSP411 family)
MHADDPVAWQDWGESALDAARDSGRLLLVSSGYFACHWCHVMQRESYRDTAIAEVLNHDFVPVKIDRELHGALDAHLIAFVEATQGMAGWPLNVFLTPEGYPLVGTTYLPPDQFLVMIERLGQAWRDEPERLRDMARRGSRQLARATADPAPAPLDASVLDRLLRDQALALGDVMQGGFGAQSRFPMAPQLLALLDLQQRRPDPALAEFLELTLDQIAAGGLRDHLGGGFFRYTVDPSWEIPHFEKMLYTQAQLAEVFMHAADLFERPDYDAVARDTLAFVARDMRGDQGGFIASFSALDGAGEEGGVYLWSDDALASVLGEADAQLARRYWSMEPPSAFAGGHLPRRGESLESLADRLQLDTVTVRARLERMRAQLLRARRSRDLPADGKQLAGWNGLMLAAFAAGAARWQDESLAAAATATRDFIVRRLWDGERLRRAVRGGRMLGKADLSDYAYVAYGLERYARSSGASADRALADALIAEAWRRFHHESGWRLDADPLIPGLHAASAIDEGALPSPSAVLVRLSLGHSDDVIRARARDAANRARAQVQTDPFRFAGHQAALVALQAER